MISFWHDYSVQLLAYEDTNFSMFTLSTFMASINTIFEVFFVRLFMCDMIDNFIGTVSNILYQTWWFYYKIVNDFFTKLLYTALICRHYINFGILPYLYLLTMSVRAISERSLQNLCRAQEIWSIVKAAKHYHRIFRCTHYIFFTTF